MNTQTRRFYFSRRLLALSIILSAFVFTFSTQVIAADFMVNFTTDHHDASLVDGVCDTNVSTAELDCTLRAAIEQANNLGSNDRILFNLPANSTIELNSAIGGEIPITNNGTLEIIGTGANNLTIDGGAGTNRIFSISEATVTILGVTLTGGNGTGVRIGGGAIIAEGDALTLDGVHVTGNSTPVGGDSGGINVRGGTNHILNSTFSANTAALSGGGFRNAFGTMTVVNSTISGNRANNGGGFASLASSVILRNATITNNTAIYGGGIFRSTLSIDTGTINFGNTIVAGNISTSGNTPEIDFGAAAITSAGGNLIGDSPGDSTNTGSNITYQPTDIRDVNPRLGALVNNGGTTPTHAVFVHSPLIDKGVNALAVDPFGGNNTALVFDQRGSGFARIVDGNGDGSAIVDIGTFERRIFGDPRPTSGDFDGDGKADIAVFRRSNGFWYVMKSTGGFSAVQWGFGTDTLVPGDYDGDGKTDVAVYRRGSQPTAFGNINDSTWYIRRGSDNTFLTRQYGKGGFYEWDTPMPADYDGDGKTDLGLYGLSDALGSPGNFKVWQSSDGLRYERQWGTNIDQIVPRDYDGDGKADLATVRIEPRFSSNGIAIWQILQSSNGATRQVQFGLATDVTVPRDYDGDGKTDIAVYRPSNGFWYRLNSSDGSFFAIQFGLSTDITVPADYDGDGKTDIAVFRPSNGTWYLQQSKDGFAAYVFGLPDDVPVTSLAR